MRGIFLPFQRATLLMPSGSIDDPDRKHLFIILTDPIEPEESTEKQVLLTSISSITPSLPYDVSCILTPGDHQFIRHDSYVFYARSIIESASALTRGVRDGKLIPYQPVSDSVFLKICNGLVNSRHTTPRMLRFYRLASGL